MKKCKATGKTKFNDKRSADKARIWIYSHDPHADLADLHSYVCPACRCYHVGHKSKYYGKEKKCQPQ